MSALDDELIQAAEFGSIRLVARALAEGADVDAEDSNGWTPLHWACSDGHLDIASMLLEADADSNAIDSHGMTPLHIASAEGRWELVSLLLKNDADVHAQDLRDGATPLHLASARNHLETTRLLLLESNSDVNALDNGGNTPLHLTIQNTPLHVVCLLLENGADVTIENADNKTPSEVARSRNCVDVSELLEKHISERFDEIQNTLVCHSNFISVAMGMFDPESRLHMLNHGTETSRGLLVLIAEYLGVPTTSAELRDLQQKTGELA